MKRRRLQRSQERIFIMVNLLVGIPENPRTLQTERNKTGIKSRNKIKGGMAVPRGGYERLHESSLTRFCAVQIGVRTFDQLDDNGCFSLFISSIRFGAWQDFNPLRAPLIYWFMDAVDAIKLWSRSLPDFTFAAFIIQCEFRAGDLREISKVIYERHKSIYNL